MYLYIYNTLQLGVATWQKRTRTATHCNTLQFTASHCNALQHTAPHYNLEQQRGNDIIEEMQKDLVGGVESLVCH